MASKSTRRSAEGLADSLTVTPRSSGPVGSPSHFPGPIANWVANITTHRRGQDVPCGNCTACCTHPNLHPDIQLNELSAFPEAVQDESMASGWRLPKTASGACVHLLEGQCSIYDRRPRACREFDCRAYLFWLQPYDHGASDFIRTVLSMWGDWELDTPSDVDHMLAMTRAVSEAISNQSASANSVVGGLSLVVDIIKLYNRYIGQAHTVRSSMGLDAARERARLNERTLRKSLIKILTTTTWVSKPPSTVPNLGDASPLGGRVEEVAMRLRSALEKAGFEF